MDAENHQATAVVPDAVMNHVPHSQTCEVLSEIQQTLKDIETLVAKGPTNDPEYKENVKKLNDIKKYLSKKMDPDRRGILSKFRRNRGRIQIRSPSGTDLIETTPSELMMDEELEQDFYEAPKPRNPDLINMNLDDSILKGIDDMISAYTCVAGFIKNRLGCHQ